MTLKEVRLKLAERWPETRDMHPSCQGKAYCLWATDNPSCEGRGWVPKELHYEHLQALADKKNINLSMDRYEVWASAKHGDVESQNGVMQGKDAEERLLAAYEVLLEVTEEVKP